ncbi:MAG: type II secretion system protein, partial [Sedimentisphaerales bacterium]
MKAKSGFTLVEILIVVVILGILAAIVIPQFTEASTEAKLNSLMSDLQTFRSQIELYKVQHNDNPPTAANFVAQMTETSDISGA